MPGENLTKLMIRILSVPVDDLLEELQEVNPLSYKFIVSIFNASCDKDSIMFNDDKQRNILLQSIVIAALGSHHETMDSIPTYDEKVITHLRHLLTPSDN